MTTPSTAQATRAAEKKRMSKQHDEPESTAAREKRLGIAAETRKAAERHTDRLALGQGGGTPASWAMLDRAFLAGARWERRRRARRGF